MKKTKPKNPEKLRELELGINAEKRIVYIEHEIDSLTPSFLDQRINYIVDLSQDEKTPITLKITSHGGDVYGMFGVIDIIKGANMPINTLGVGSVFSAAAFILSSGTGIRAVTKNTIVMLHMMSTWFGGSTSDVLAEANHLKELQNKLYQFLADHTSKNFSFWEKNSRVNLYLTAEKCLEYKIIDKII